MRPIVKAPILSELTMNGRTSKRETQMQLDALTAQEKVAFSRVKILVDQTPLAAYRKEALIRAVEDAVDAAVARVTFDEYGHI